APAAPPAPPTPRAITGNAADCPAAAYPTRRSYDPGATSYTWTLPGGWTGTTTTNNITATEPATSGNIPVSANNACGSSASQTLAVAVTPAPATPGAITGNAAVCPAGANTYSVAETAGATSYTWTLPGGWTGTSTTNSITATAGTTSGNITVSANNACGSSAVRTLALTVTVVDTAVSQSGITLTATAAGATYQWINCTSNAIISGQTNQSYTAAENGTYAVIVTQNGCSDTSACLAVTTVGIEDDGALSSIVLYPNPSNGHFQFSIDGSQVAQGGKLEIYTVEGKRIYQSIITQTISDLDLSHQASGMYWVRFYNGQTILTKKMVLE
ncbi:MAG: T9SS type A sorting domain-containing protein, partial [Bacteroidia bacterium]|nr:T9SS type A sorting domain-containing protein [Bacteroidia bacterium]